MSKYKSGEWFASMKADGNGYILWRQTTEGPVREALVYREGAATEMVERLNEPSLAQIEAILGPLFKAAFGDLAQEVLIEVLAKTKNQG
jgi:hypothetical protein